MSRKHQLLLAVLALAGCVSVNKSILTVSPAGKTFALSDVTVYFESDSIPEHTRVAILNAKGDVDMTNEGEMIDKLREEAGKLGANAIILGELEEPGAGRRAVSAVFGTPKDRESQAIAIYVPSLDESR